MLKELINGLKEHLEGDPTPFYGISFSDADGNIETLRGIPGNPCQNVYSVAKAYTACAVGLAYDRGLIKPEDRICDLLRRFVPEKKDERWEDVTVDMALTHRTGLPGTFLDIDACDPRAFGRDYLGYTFSSNLVYDPGTDSKYTDGSFYLLSRAVEAVTGSALDDYLLSELLYDVGFTELAWSRCPLGHPMGATGLYIKAEDTVKLGTLYLNKGAYGGKRYLSEEWVDMSLERGYGFGPDPNGLTYSKGGMRGQVVAFAPKLGLAASMQSLDGDTGALFRYIEKIEQGS